MQNLCQLSGHSYQSRNKNGQRTRQPLRLNQRLDNNNNRSANNQPHPSSSSGQKSKVSQSSSSPPPPCGEKLKAKVTRTGTLFTIMTISAFGTQLWLSRMPYHCVPLPARWQTVAPTTAIWKISSGPSPSRRTPFSFFQWYVREKSLHSRQTLLTLQYIPSQRTSSTAALALTVYLWALSHVSSIQELASILSILNFLLYSNEPHQTRKDATFLHCHTRTPLHGRNNTSSR